MDEMRIYICNLGKYNEGELVGAWFTPPVNFDEVKERIDSYELVILIIGLIILIIIQIKYGTNVGK